MFVRMLMCKRVGKGVWVWLRKGCGGGMGICLVSICYILWTISLTLDYVCSFVRMNNPISLFL